VSVYHVPVMVNELLQYLVPKKGGVYVDATFGGGGHTTAILRAAPESTVIAFDWDPKAFELNAHAIEEAFPGQLQAVKKSFSHVARELHVRKIAQVDGIVADFGTSQYQLRHAPGFSFHTDSLLDMRMSPGTSQITAADIIQRSSEQELGHIFWTYGGEIHARQIARALVRARTHIKIKTTQQLARIVAEVIAPTYGKIAKKRIAIHPATKVFQALRIVVNRECEEIEHFLKQAFSVLKPGGRLVCITFHSLEDRLVKQYLRGHPSLCVELTRKVVYPAAQEIEHNPSARSAKLRAGEKARTI